MANIESAKKRMRSDAKKAEQNATRKGALATYEKSLDKAIAAGELEKAQELLKVCFAKFDKAAKCGVVKKETAARKKSRLTLRVNKALAAK